MPGIFQQMGHCCYTKGVPFISFRSAYSSSSSAIASRQLPLQQLNYNARLRLRKGCCQVALSPGCRAQLAEARWFSNCQPSAGRRGGNNASRRVNGRRCLSSAHGLKDDLEESRGRHEVIRHPLKSVKDSPAQDISNWKHAFQSVQIEHGKDGVWECFELLLRQNQLHQLLLPDAEDLRDDIIEAAVIDDKRIEKIIEVDRKLSVFGYSGWPDLYVKTMYFLVKEGNAQRMMVWHHRLLEIDPPGPDEIAGLFSSLVQNSHWRIQECLGKLYVSGLERQLYDFIIPALFDAGQLKLARKWRKLFIQQKDFPLSSRSRPFIRFLKRYYPMIELTEEESFIISRPLSPETLDEPPIVADTSAFQPALRRDGLVAKWFASTWVSIEFAINLVYRLGIEAVGARSLQALTLRESTSELVLVRLQHLERLGIKISPQVYCHALTYFARTRNDPFLCNLAACDIHPDEFDNPKKRRTLREYAAQQGDMERVALLRAVEMAIENQPSHHELNRILRRILHGRHLGKAKIVLDRMNALQVSITEDNAQRLLDRVFWGLGKHPKKRGIRVSNNAEQRMDPLDRAIRIVRQLRFHYIPIPIGHWKTLFYNLGRTGRFDELEQLMIEFVQLFRPPTPRLIPIWDHLPETGTEKQKQYIPSDLEFTHRRHPVQEVFDGPMQRSILRWGFDDAVQRMPKISSFERTRPSDFDIACGVRMLASLRDQGVLIETGMISSQVPLRISKAIAAGKTHRSRDSKELSHDHVRELFQEAWGSDLFENMPSLGKMLKARRTGRANIGLRLNQGVDDDKGWKHLFKDGK
ncbi:unnamed protein product [Clonostachys rosea f. rosea IK726]|uniref:Pentatricopeptide repeat domain-containing protein n=2 Tax=Bionectria ochroleuca TaxID=29856 RepID=A0A0B7JXR1_BIOOC|nr:unnamed protein product [Clonostachys rosea f. rosea IK726]